MRTLTYSTAIRIGLAALLLATLMELAALAR